MSDKVTIYIQTAPQSVVGILERAFAKKGGRSNAIKAKCLACSNFVRDEVRHCSATTCPLHPWRPFQLKPGAAPETESTEFDDLDQDEPEEQDDDEL